METFPGETRTDMCPTQIGYQPQSKESTRVHHDEPMNVLGPLGPLTEEFG